MVDWENRMVHIPRTKNQQPIHVNPNQDAFNALRKIRCCGTSSDRVFRAKSSGEPYAARGRGLNGR